MEMEIHQRMADLVSDFRMKIRQDIPEATRELLMEFAACIVEQELQESSADEDIRAGSLIFLKHRILKHGGSLLSCSKCMT